MSEDATDIDRHIGKRLHLQRVRSGLSLRSLGDVAGVSFQQIGKYERGENRISASTLYSFAKALSVPCAFFFEGLPQPSSITEPDIDTATIESGLSRETWELTRVYSSVKSDAVRCRIRELVRTLSEEFS